MTGSKLEKSDFGSKCVLRMEHERSAQPQKRSEAWRIIFSLSSFLFLPSDDVEIRPMNDHISQFDASQRRERCTIFFSEVYFLLNAFTTGNPFRMDFT